MLSLLSNNIPPGAKTSDDVYQNLYLLPNFKKMNILQIDFADLLQWLAVVKAYSGSYKQEFVHICELLAKDAKEDEAKTDQFIQLLLA